MDILEFYVLIKPETGGAPQWLTESGELTASFHEAAAFPDVGTARNAERDASESDGSTISYVLALLASAP